MDKQAADRLGGDRGDGMKKIKQHRAKWVSDDAGGFCVWVTAAGTYCVYWDAFAECSAVGWSKPCDSIDQAKRECKKHFVESQRRKK